MMAASCKNLTFSSSGSSTLIVLTASSFVAPEMLQIALCTSPNSPEPSCSRILRRKFCHKKKKSIIMNIHTFLWNNARCLTLADLLESLGTFLKPVVSKDLRS